MEKFLELFIETIEIEDYEVKPEDKFRDYEEWDSLAYLAVLAMIKDEYNITLPRETFDNFQTVNDIYNFVNSQ